MIYIFLNSQDYLLFVLIRVIRRLTSIVENIEKMMTAERIEVGMYLR